MPHQQILKGCLLGITDPKDQRHPLFAKCLLSVKQCNSIVDEINLLSKREVILPTHVSREANQGNSESIQVLEVEVSCSGGTLKLNEKYECNECKKCRRRM